MWRVPKSTSTCARQPLAQLLTDQLDAKAAARVTEHLDRCEECQQRMTKLAAEPNWWREAGQWLENASIDEELAGEWSEDEFGEHQGASPEQSLIESGLMRPSTKMDTIGSIGRYDVRRVIGTGGTGIVLQAVDTELDRIIAVKVLAPTFASNGPARRRFSREGQAAAAVVHENVVAIHHVESNGPVPFLVMQYVDGCSLQEQVIRVGPMDATSTLRMVSQLASALDAAHAQGLVHRDVKPANILVGAAGQRVWITDFGLARAVDDASLTRTGFIAGTPHYMSPEQARGETVGPGSDLFGLGSVMYFVLTGRPPFRAERSLAILNRICTEKHRPVREVNPDVPPAVAAIVDRLLEKNASCAIPISK
jgi:serine/threonine protein kinase